MNDVLALEGSEEVPASDEAAAASMQESDGSSMTQKETNKDKMFNEEFMQKSLTSVCASIIRFTNAIIGLSTAAID